MKKLSKELFDKYASDPLKYDAEVRKFAEVPEKKYYTVDMWSEHNPDCVGTVRVLEKSDREVKTKKISKSDQK